MQETSTVHGWCRLLTFLKKILVSLVYFRKSRYTCMRINHTCILPRSTDSIFPQRADVLSACNRALFTPGVSLPPPLKQVFISFHGTKRLWRLARDFVLYGGCNCGRFNCTISCAVVCVGNWSQETQPNRTIDNKHFHIHGKALKLILRRTPYTAGGIVEVLLWSTAAIEISWMFFKVSKIADSSFGSVGYFGMHTRISLNEHDAFFVGYLHWGLSWKRQKISTRIHQPPLCVHLVLNWE